MQRHQHCRTARRLTGQDAHHIHRVRRIEISYRLIGDHHVMPPGQKPRQHGAGEFTARQRVHGPVGERLKMTGRKG